MQPTSNSVNIENTKYKTVHIPEESVNDIKQKLGDEFIWRYDEKSNQLYLSEKSKANADFSTEFSKEMSEKAYQRYNGELANKWDD